MAYNYVTVTATYQTTPGTAANGRYEWYPSTSVVDSSTGDEMDIAPILAQLDSTGSFSVVLLATDNANLSTFYWAYNKWIEGEEVGGVTYYVRFADGATQALDKLTVAP